MKWLAFQKLTAGEGDSYIQMFRLAERNRPAWQIPGSQTT